MQAIVFPDKRMCERGCERDKNRFQSGNANVCVSFKNERIIQQKRDGT